MGSREKRNQARRGQSKSTGNESKDSPSWRWHWCGNVTVEPGSIDTGPRPRLWLSLSVNVLAESGERRGSTQGHRGKAPAYSKPWGWEVPMVPEGEEPRRRWDRQTCITEAKEKRVQSGERQAKWEETSSSGLEWGHWSFQGEKV